MLRASRILGRAALPVLTYVAGDHQKLTPVALDYLAEDAAEKRVVMPKYEKRAFAFDARTPDGKVAGSIAGHTVWNEVHLSLFCANPALRIPGTGKLLMRSVEEMARDQGYTRMNLDTYSWQARPFYETLGYKLFATEEDYPVGHERYFMEKRWRKGDPFDPSPYELTGRSEAARGIKAVPADVDEASARLGCWLDDDTQGRKVPGVKHYVKTEYSLEARLPDGSVGAICCFETLWDNLHISFLTCHPGKANQSIGSCFLGHMVDLAKAQGCNRISLETFSRQAQRFYERNGFGVFGIQRDIPVDGMDRIFMQRRFLSTGDSHRG